MWKKILNQCNQIFLCRINSHWTLKIRAQLKWGRLDMIGIKYAWKRLKKLCMKIKYPFHQCKDSLDQKLNPNHSIHKQDANPSAKDLKLRPKAINKFAFFV